MKMNRAKLLPLLIALVVCQIAAVAQNTELADYIKANYTKREAYVPVRDGVKLFLSVYEPKDKSQKYPILLNRTPYSVAPYGQDKFRTSLGPSALYAKEGYIFVYQDVRGRWMSEGEFEDVRPDIDNRTPKNIDESTDTYDTVEWMLKNIDNNNGKVGLYGISYPGFYTSASVIDTHPAIKAASPQAPVSDWFHGDDMHHNGALFLAQNYAFFGNFGQPRPVPTSDPKYMKQWQGRDTQDGYNYFLSKGGLKETADEYMNGIGMRIKFWDAMMAHPNYDQFWKDRNILPKLKNIKCAVLTVGGWYDNENLYGAIGTYHHIENQNPGIFNAIVVGPWDHGGWSRNDGDWLGTAYFGSKTGEYYRAYLELPFFNHFLKDKPGMGDVREINIYDTGAHKWYLTDQSILANAKDKTLYLQAGGKLSVEAPKTAGNSFDEYVSDPMKPVPYTQKITMNYPRDFMTEDQRFVAGRPDVLVYQTEPLTEDMTVVGAINPSLFVSTSGTDSDFVVKLIDVFPDNYKYPEGLKPPQNSAWTVFQPGGYQMLLRGEPMPARFRKSFEAPVAMRPNVPEKVEFMMPPIAHTFKKGHRVMIQIQSTWFPLVARNPQKFMANYKMGTQANFQKATERVYRSKAMASSVRLRVVNN